MSINLQTGQNLGQSNKLCHIFAGLWVEQGVVSRNPGFFKTGIRGEIFASKDIQVKCLYLFQLTIESVLRMLNIVIIKV